METQRTPPSQNLGVTTPRIDAYAVELIKGTDVAEISIHIDLSID